MYAMLALCCGPKIASLPLPGYVVKGDERVVLQHKLILLFCVGIVHTNLYNCISRFPGRILYLELFDIASNACG